MYQVDMLANSSLLPTETLSQDVMAVFCYVFSAYRVFYGKLIFFYLKATAFYSQQFIVQLEGLKL